MVWMVDMVENDKAVVDCCNTIFVNSVKPRVGKSIKVLYGWERGKPAITFEPTDAVVSPQLVYHSHQMFHTVEEAIAYTNLMRNPNKSLGRIDCCQVIYFCLTREIYKSPNFLYRFNPDSNTVSPALLLAARCSRIRRVIESFVVLDCKISRKGLRA